MVLCPRISTHGLLSLVVTLGEFPENIPYVPSLMVTDSHVDYEQLLSPSVLQSNCIEFDLETIHNHNHQAVPSGLELSIPALHPRVEQLRP